MNNAGEAELPFNRTIVFHALFRAVQSIGMSVHSSDLLSGRMVVKTGTSLTSWGENITISLASVSENNTRVAANSTSKTGVTSGGFLTESGIFGTFDPTFGKHRKNVEAIFAALSAELRKERPALEQKKKCPFCAELIQPEAIKCRYCGADLPIKPPAIPRELSHPVDNPVWFVMVDDDPRGPHSVGELTDMMARGEITNQSLCARSGDQEWKRLEDIPRVLSL